MIISPNVPMMYIVIITSFILQVDRPDVPHLQVPTLEDREVYNEHLFLFFDIHFYIHMCSADNKSL